MNYSPTDLAKILAANPDLQVDGTAEERAPLAAKQPKPKLSEHEMQVAVIAKCDSRGYGPIFAIPNGGQRNAGVGGKLKAEGVRAGVPDLFLAAQRWQTDGTYYSGLFIELKVGGNKPTSGQAWWLDRLKAEGYLCAVIYDDPDDAIKLIEWYLGDANNEGIF